jgi:haloalkane dehalogenase
MHYVDEGQGEVLLFVHGNPSWSFEYRKLIAHFSACYRCIAPDHLGFGLSDKPADVSCLPQFHAANLKHFIDGLGLTDITLVVQDWGGPIALDYAVAHPERIKRVVAFNSWFFNVRDQTVLRRFSALLGSTLGRFLCERFNFFPRVLMPASFGERSRLTRAVHAQYLAPFSIPVTRKGTWVLPGAITRESDWLDKIWKRRSAIAHLPVLLAWGMKDAAFAPLLKRWEAAFPAHRSIVLDDIGHSVAEEAGERLVAPLSRFLSSEAQT